MQSKMRLLFCCHDNRCLGPMAEGWARRLRGSRIEAVAAGIVAGERDPWAVRVMAESGVDIHRLPARSLSEVARQPFDLVVALTTDTLAALPHLPGDPRVLSLAIQPPQVTPAAPATGGSARGLRAPRQDAARLLERYRDLRDEIRGFVETLPAALVPVNAKYYWVQPEFLQPAAARS